MPSDMIRLRDGRAEVCAAYDWGPVMDVKDWVDWSLSCFGKAGFQADYILADKGSSPKKVSSLSAIDWSGPIRGVQLLAMRPGWKQLAFDWEMCSVLDIKNGELAFVGAKSGTLDQVTTLTEMTGMLRPPYGIGFTRDFRKGPGLYVYGMVTGLGYAAPDLKEKHALGAWMRERLSGRNRHQTGMLRDVFPLNLVTDFHLSQMVEGISLQDWIQRDRRRGSLSDLGQNRWIWRLEDEVQNEIREVLRHSGLLIAYE